MDKLVSLHNMNAKEFPPHWSAPWKLIHHILHIDHDTRKYRKIKDLQRSMSQDMEMIHYMMVFMQHPKFE